jgi:hypothetical protein
MLLDRLGFERAERKMLRMSLAAVVFSLLCRATPIFAAQSCEDWCENRCAHPVLSQGVCMNKCVPACQQRRGQDSRVNVIDCITDRLEKLQILIGNPDPGA